MERTDITTMHLVKTLFATIFLGLQSLSGVRSGKSRTASSLRYPSRAPITAQPHAATAALGGGNESLQRECPHLRRLEAEFLWSVPSLGFSDTPTPTATCTSAIPCLPTICPTGSCYVLGPPPGRDCPLICSCGPIPAASQAPCTTETACQSGFQAVPTSYGANCRHCVCVPKPSPTLIRGPL
jgi:hypothetical protein